MAGQKDKGGGSRKYGNKQRACSLYKERESRGNTAKTRRIARALVRGMHQPGWMLRSNGKAMRDPSYRQK